MDVHEQAETGAAALQALIAKVTDSALRELDALRVAVEVRSDAVMAALTAPDSIDPAWLREALDQFAHTAREEADHAASAARTQAFEEAEIRWEFERAGFEKQLDALRAQAAAERESDRAQYLALSNALQEAKVQADVIRARADAQLDAARIAQTQLLEETHAQIEAAQTEADRALTAQRSLLDETRGQLEQARGELSGARNQLDETRGHLVETREHLDGTRTELVETRVLLESMRAELTEAQRARAESQHTIDAAHAEARRAIDAAHAETRQALEAAHVETERAMSAQQRMLDEARSQFEESRSQFEESRSQLEATRNQLAASQSQLEDAQVARMEAIHAADAARARVEAMQRELAGEHASEAEKRTTLSQALDAARAQWDTARTEARAQLETALAAHSAALADAQAERDRAHAALADAQAERDTARAEAQAAQQELRETAAAPSAPADRGITSLLSHLATAVRTVDDAASLTQVLDALLDGVSAVFPHASLFLVKSDRLQGWRRVGGDPAATSAPPADVPLTVASPLTQALTTGRVIVAGHDLTTSGQASAEGALTVTLPLVVGQRVVALVHADESERPAEGVSYDRQTALMASDLLVRHAARCLAVLTATASLPTTIRSDRAQGSTGSDARAAALGPVNRPRAREANSVEDAQRYARLLVSEIKRYNEANLKGGSQEGGLYDRLKDDIERCRRLYAGRIPAEIRATSNFFDDALLEILAGGDPEALRRLEHAVEPGPPPQAAPANPPAASAEGAADAPRPVPLHAD